MQSLIKSLHKQGARRALAKDARSLVATPQMNFAAGNPTRP